MKAIVYHTYGSPEVLKLEEVAKPTAGDGEVLVKIYAVAINAADGHLLRGQPFLVRPNTGLFKPKKKILGSDIAGRVEAVGRNVTQFQPGDDVFGDLSAVGRGGFAEYVAVPESALALKPAGVSFKDAAAVPMAGVTALQGLRDHGQLQAGQKVLINGASGGVGTFAVQIAKALGAEVTAVVSTRKVALTRSLGADHVIDYTQEDFTQNGQRYDLIFDTAGNRKVAEYQQALMPTGTFVTTTFLPALMFRGLRSSKPNDPKMINMMAKPGQDHLTFMKTLLEAGQVVPVVDRSYLLGETAEAFRYLGEGHAQGKVVIIVADDLETFEATTSLELNTVESIWVGM